MRDGVILSLNKNNQFYREFTIEIAKHCRVNPNTPWKKIKEEDKMKNFIRKRSNNKLFQHIHRLELQ